VRLEPELRQQLQEAATAAGSDVSSWLRHAVHQVTRADFPASWHAAAPHTTRRDTGRRPEMRSHDSRYYKQRYMLRLDDVSWHKLDELAQVFDTSMAEVIRQLVVQATLKQFPKSWQLAAEERQQQRARQVDTSKARRS